jgi:hypothetical protein
VLQAARAAAAEKGDASAAAATAELATTLLATMRARRVRPDAFVYSAAIAAAAVGGGGASAAEALLAQVCQSSRRHVDPRCIVDEGPGGPLESSWEKT